MSAIREARLESGVPQTEGWFVVNARETRWSHNELGSYCGFEGEGAATFADLGFNLNLLPPGAPMAMYHEEGAQEDFLVLRGECLLIVEGEERTLREWDFVHCPPWTKHVLVGAGNQPCIVLAVGTRGKESARYPFDEAAVRHGAGAERATTSAREAYARFSRPREGPVPDDF